MRAHKTLGLVVLVLSVGYFYVLYPLPSQRVAEAVDAEAQTQPQTHTESSGGITGKKQGGIRLSFDANQLEKSLWIGWWGGLAIVLLGLVAGMLMIRAGPTTTGSIMVLVFCVVFIVVYWSQTVIPLEKPFGQFIGFKVDMLGSLIRIGAYGRFAMELHQAVSALVFHVLGIYFLVVLMKRVRQG